MKTLLFFILLSLTISITGYCQDVNCKVLKPEIAGKYEGACEKGLAQGEGISSGLDTYTGHFKKGLPEGEGSCHYHTGEIFTGKWHKGERSGPGKLVIKLASGADSICEGIWEHDKYKGIVKGPPYEIENQSGSVFPRIHNLGPGNKIELTIEHPMGNNLVRNVQIMMKGAATSKESYGMYIYEDVKFPFELNITYSAPNKIKTAMIDSSIRLRFLEPAYWKVILQN